jgi:hypothetical protein
MLFHERQSGHGKTATMQRAVRNDKGMALTTRRGARTTERLVSFPKDTLADSQRFSAWLRTARKGDTFVSWTTDWDSKDINVKMTFTFQEKKPIVWGGRQVLVYVGVLKGPGTSGKCELLENGEPFSLSLFGGLVTIRMEEEAAAKKLGRGADVSASFVAIDRDLGSSGHDVRKLTLEVKGLDGYSLPQSHRQRSRAGKDRAVIVELQPDFRVAKGSPLTSAQKTEYTRATARVQSDHEAIRKLARKIVGDEKDPVKMATLLSKWAHRNLRYDFRHAWANDALTVLDNRSGVCADFALLYVALARAVGLPAREVGGLAYVNPRKPQLRWKRYWLGSLPTLQMVGKPQFAWHAWAEVHDGSQWVNFDPTMNLVYVSATHIKFSEEDDPRWKDLMGKLAIKVVAVERAGRPVAQARKQ